MRSKQPLFLRLMPLLFLGSFASIYNYHIGQYGVYRNVDELFKVLTDKRDTQVGLEAYTFLKDLAEQEAQKLNERVALRKEREKEYAEKHGLSSEEDVKKEKQRLRDRIWGANKEKKNEALGNTDDEHTEETQKKKRFF